MATNFLGKLDLIFPYVCFVYGALMTVVHQSDTLNRLADERLPADLITRWRAHRVGAVACLVVGAIWILQNLWLT